MSRTLHTLRASLALGAFLMACAAPTQAADTAPQRLAMANTAEAGSTKALARHVARTERAPAQVQAKDAARRAQDTRMASRDNDGSRFTYDSCGCSN